MITIVILLILAAVLVNLTLGDNGLFTKTRLAKQQYEYAEAKEIVDLKLVDIHAECMTKGEDFVLKRISEEMTSDTQITIDKKYFKTTGLIKDGVSDSNVNLKGIVVSANVHPQYEFLIGEKGDTVALLGVTTEELPATWTGDNLPEEFSEISDFEQITLNQDIANNNKSNAEKFESCIISVSSDGSIIISGIENLKAFSIIVDDEVLATTNEGSYSLVSGGISSGTHSIKVIAMDEDSKLYTSNPVNYTFGESITSTALNKREEINYNTCSLTINNDKTIGITGVNNIQSVYIIADDEFCNITEDLNQPIGKIGDLNSQHNVHVIVIDNNGNLYKSNNEVYISDNYNDYTDGYVTIEAYTMPSIEMRRYTEAEIDTNGVYNETYSGKITVSQLGSNVGGDYLVFKTRFYIVCDENVTSTFGANLDDWGEIFVNGQSINFPETHLANYTTNINFQQGMNLVEIFWTEWTNNGYVNIKGDIFANEHYKGILSY